MVNMNTFWLKVAGVIVLIVALVVVISRFSGSKEGQKAQPGPKEKTVGDVWRADDKRLRAEPNKPAQPPSGQQAAGGQAATEQPKPMQFKALTEEEQAGAEQLFELAITQRKMARLPGMSYGLMVNYCRDIIQKYPGSEFDYKARRMLGEVPRDHWERFKITEEEINGFPLSRE
jgi:type IV secretory pathway VirB10-like protein